MNYDSEQDDTDLPAIRSTSLWGPTKLYYTLQHEPTTFPI
jgi:hypothetical protein